jgi:23S rRNA pseudouridine1911/1915/1917 synthase
MVNLVHVLEKEDSGKKIEHILRSRFHFSRKLIQKLKLGEYVWLDGDFIFLNSTGKEGQTLIVNLQENEESTIKGEDLPLEILYEDSLFLAVNKQADQVVHPNSRYQTGTLANAVVGYWEKKNEYRPFRPISRLDRNTSGIVLIAKNRYAHQQIARQSAKKQLTKKYLGLVQGQFPYDSGEFNYPIRLKEDSKIVREIHQQGLPSKTLYRTLKRYQDFTLLEFTLVTGRTHQIRVHCQSSGYPLIGDDLYGADTSHISRQALHCHSYAFTNPLTGQRTVIHAPLPEDMKLLIEADSV